MTRGVSLLFHDVFIADPAESGFLSEAANRYKLSIEDFDAQLEAVAAVRGDAPLIVKSLGGSEGRKDGSTQRSPRMPWLITVDDGGLSYYTLIADRLEARGWRGHCFVSTDFIGRFGFLDVAQIRELDARGHVIGSHSASHPPRFSACSFKEMVGEWRDSRARLEDIVGHAVDVGSVPGGYFSAAVARAAREAGLRLLFTSEPVTTVARQPDFTLIGRFVIRCGDATDSAARFLLPTPWARAGAWATWNAKGLIKPLLGSSYRRVADRVCAMRRATPSLAAGEIRRGRS